MAWYWIVLLAVLAIAAMTVVAYGGFWLAVRAVAGVIGSLLSGRRVD